MSLEESREINYLRQLDIANPKDFKLPVSILGCGAAGSAIAIGLAKMGISDLSLVDYDSFEAHNVANQFCLEKDHVGKNKASALATLICAMSAMKMKEIHSYPVKLVGDHFEHYVDCTKKFIPTVLSRSEVFRGILISCPDDMQARMDLWNYAKLNPKTPYIIDTRMSGQFVVIYAESTLSSSSIARYQKTLYTNEQASEDPCGARGIIYTSMMVGSLVVNLVKKIQLQEKIPHELRFDLYNGEFTQFFDGQMVSNREALVPFLVEG